MSIRILASLATSLLLAIAFCPGIQAGKKTAKFKYTWFGGPGTGGLTRFHDVRHPFGFSNSLMLDFKNSRPIAYFGIHQQSTGKRRFIYLILFKAPAKRPSSTKWGGNSGDRATRNYVFRVKGAWSFAVLYKKRIETTISLEENVKTGKLLSETLKIGGKELKKDDPRVFLVDLTQGKVTYQPVRVKLPKHVPSLEDTRQKNMWEQTMDLAIEQLKRESAEVRKFLDTPPTK